MTEIRKTMRFRQYDYSSPGYSFITQVTFQRKNLFGTIDGEVFQPSAAGSAVAAVWNEISSHFPCVQLDEFCLMPNHLHGLLLVMEGENTPSSLVDVMQWFKIVSTKRYFLGVKKYQWPIVDGHVWQRSYYDRIVRSEDELRKIRSYIENNPINWAADEERIP